MPSEGRFSCDTCKACTIANNEPTHEISELIARENSKVMYVIYVYVKFLPINITLVSLRRSFWVPTTYVLVEN